MARTRVRWGRVAGLSAKVVLVLGSLVGRAGAGGPSDAPPSRPVSVYVVRSGETVWGIARSLVGEEGDPRPVVDALVRANHLAGGTVQPGERLIVPTL
jgi:Tfp pilus assembly protein FimV